MSHALRLRPPSRGKLAQLDGFVVVAGLEANSWQKGIKGKNFSHSWKVAGVLRFDADLDGMEGTLSILLM